MPKTTTRPGKRCLAQWIEDAEYTEFFRRAAAAGMTGTDFFRHGCLGAQPKSRRKGPDVQEIHRIRGRIGKLLGHTNQLAAVANDVRALPELAELVEIRKTIHAMHENLARALGYGS